MEELKHLSKYHIWGFIAQLHYGYKWHHSVQDTPPWIIIIIKNIRKSPKIAKKKSQRSISRKRKINSIKLRLFYWIAWRNTDAHNFDPVARLRVHTYSIQIFSSRYSRQRKRDSFIVNKSSGAHQCTNLNDL